MARIVNLSKPESFNASSKLVDSAIVPLAVTGPTDPRMTAPKAEWRVRRQDMDRFCSAEWNRYPIG